MRQTYILCLIIVIYVTSCLLIGSSVCSKRVAVQDTYRNSLDLVEHLGFYDVCLSTEARYSRHPVASDKMTVVMDHPGALDHFPSTLFWAAVP